jgi:hypothetical protein
MPASPRLEPPDALVDPAVDLPLDPVEEARDEGIVVPRAQLPSGGQRGLQLAFSRRFDVETVGESRVHGKGRTDLL